MQPNGKPTPAEPKPATGHSNALRDRTDEIELIISGLTTFALLSLPGWLLDRFVDLYPHMSVAAAVAAEISLMIVSGLSYMLGSCFLVHLLARAYWVGLIGLRSVFPSGIDWTNTPGVGPQQREYYRRWLPDLDSAIARTDRMASGLFAVIGLIAIAVLWIGVTLVVVAVLGGVIGSRYGVTQTGMTVGLTVLAAIMALLPLLTWMVDRFGSPRFGERPGFRRLIRGLTRAYGLFYPQRLILPVQLTVQSNTRPVVFIVLMAAGMFGMVFGGNLNWQMFSEFSLSGEYRHIDEEAVSGGLRSSHYEDQRVGKDRVRFYPMIPTLRQRGAFVPLFLPYFPLRDNVVLENLCDDGPASSGSDCVHRLWSVSLNGTDIPTADFLAAERLDLGLRGLTGFIPTTGLAPGMHRIEVVWNPRAAPDDRPPDDRLSVARRTYSIPFLFDPEFEQGME